jgi:tetratricopeptide (TPR) repeat protein
VADSARIQELRRRVRQDPATLAFAPLAEELRRSGQTGEAIRVCEAGLAIHPEYHSARVTLGRALLDAGQFEHAFLELTTVLGVAPENLTALRGVAEIHERRGELEDALTKYRLALSITGRDPELQRVIRELEHRMPTVSAAVHKPAPSNQESGAGSNGHDRETVRQLERFLAAVLDDRDRRAAGG